MKEHIEHAPIHHAGPFRTHGSYISIPFYIRRDGTIAYKAILEIKNNDAIITQAGTIQIDSMPEEDEFYTTMYSIKYIADKALGPSSTSDKPQYPALVSIYKYSVNGREVRDVFVYYFTSSDPHYAAMNLYTLRGNRGEYLGMMVVVCFSNQTCGDELNNIQRVKFVGFKGENTYELRNIFKRAGALLTKGRAEIKSYPLFMKLATKTTPVLREENVFAGLYEEYLMGGHIVLEKESIARFIPSPGFLKLRETQVDWGFIPKNIVRDVVMINIEYDLDQIYDGLVEFYEQVVSEAINILHGQRGKTAAVFKLVVEDPKITLKSISDQMFYTIICKNLEEHYQVCRDATWATAPITYRVLLRLDDPITERLPLPFSNRHSDFMPSGRAVYLVSQINLSRLTSIYERVRELFSMHGVGDPIFNHAVIVAAAIEGLFESIQRRSHGGDGSPKRTHEMRQNFIHEISKARGLSTSLAQFLAARALLMGVHALSNTAISRVSRLFGLHRYLNVNNVLSEFVVIAVSSRMDKALSDLFREYQRVEGVIIDGVLMYLVNKKGVTKGGFNITVKREGSALLAKNLVDDIIVLRERICEDLFSVAGGYDDDSCYTDWIQRRGVYEYGIYEVVRSVTHGLDEQALSALETYIKNPTPTVRSHGQASPNPLVDVYPPLSTARRIVSSELSNLKKDLEKNTSKPLPSTIDRLLDAVTLAKVPYCFDGCYACVMHDGCAYRFYDLRVLQASKYMAKLICTLPKQVQH